MDFLTRLERRFAWIGIPNLIMYVVIGRAIVWVLGQMNPEYPSWLLLDPAAVQRGEVWRLVTWVFYMASGNPFWVFISLAYASWVGRALEGIWGSFRFTLYYSLGVAGTALVAFWVLRVPATPFYLDTTLFLALATLLPDAVIYVFFVIPVKLKWLGWIAAVGLASVFLSPGWTGKLFVMISFANYLTFFHRTMAGWPRSVARSLRGRRVAGPAAPILGPGPRHRCTTCHRTEGDDPTLEFRYCACEECGEGREFCMEHLTQHRGARA